MQIKIDNNRNRKSVIAVSEPNLFAIFNLLIEPNWTDFYKPDRRTLVRFELTAPVQMPQLPSLSLPMTTRTRPG